MYDRLSFLVYAIILLGISQTIVYDASAVTAAIYTDIDEISLGQDLTIRVAEPDANFDSRTVDRLPLDVLFITTDKFDEEPLDKVLSKTGIHASQQFLMETGFNTGIFQVILESINSRLVDRGEDIRIFYFDDTASGGGSSTRIETVVHVVTASIAVRFDKNEYSPSDKINLIVVAPMFNVNRNKADTLNTPTGYKVAVTGASGQTYYPSMCETGMSTGIFVGKIKLTTDSTKGGDLVVKSGDTVRVTVVIAPGFAVSDSALVAANLGSILFDRRSYTVGDTVELVVTDPDENRNSDEVDTVLANVWSSTDIDGITVTLQESETSSGRFEGRFALGSRSNGMLHVSDNDMIFARYIDRTLPSAQPGTKGIFASVKVGSLPIYKIMISKPSLLDQNGTLVQNVKAGDFVTVQSSVTNSGAERHQFVYITSVKDQDGFTSNLAFITGNLEPFQSIKLGRSWMPESAGKYTVEVFVWNSIEEPSILSTVNSIVIIVGE